VWFASCCGWFCCWAFNDSNHAYRTTLAVSPMPIRYLPAPKPCCSVLPASRNPRREFSLSCHIAASGGSGNAYLEASCICLRLYDLRGYIGQQVVRGIAHRLHGGRAADCAQHCERIARQKRGVPCATLHTDCATEARGIVSGIAHGLRDGRANGLQRRSRIGGRFRDGIGPSLAAKRSY